MPDVGAALPKTPRDYLPLLLPVALALAALPFIPSSSTWVTLTIASLAMGMMIFIMASGLTLIFGLMDVLNFGHGAFIAIGAYVATLVLLPLAPWMQADSIWLNLVAVIPAVVLAMGATALLGLAFERVLIVSVGLTVFVAMLLILNRSKIGLLIRAGVENTEMVEALGYRITRLFVGVFMAGSA